MRRSASALAGLTYAHALSLLREALVRRSLGWPVALVIGTLLAVVAVTTVRRGNPTVLVLDGAPAWVEPTLHDAGFATVRGSDPVGPVQREVVLASTDGHQLNLGRGGPDAGRLEIALRRHHGSTWLPDVEGSLPDLRTTEIGGRRICRLLGGLYALYGAVFGLGALARDRDEGTLDAELTLPIGSWMPAFARWLAASLLLGLSWAVAVGMIDALLGVRDAGAMVRDGIGATAAAAALGVAAVGRAGLKASFSGPFTAVAAGIAGIVAFGTTWPGWGRHLPIASMVLGGDGWSPMFVGWALGPLAAVLFAWRGGRT